MGAECASGQAPRKARSQCGDPSPLPAPLLRVHSCPQGNLWLPHQVPPFSSPCFLVALPTPSPALGLPNDRLHRVGPRALLGDTQPDTLLFLPWRGRPGCAAASCSKVCRDRTPRAAQRPWPSGVGACAVAGAVRGWGWDARASPCTQRAAPPFRARQASCGRSHREGGEADSDSQTS